MKWPPALPLDGSAAGKAAGATGPAANRRSQRLDSGAWCAGSVCAHMTVL
jgi:hypothetical protein